MNREIVSVTMEALPAAGSPYQFSAVSLGDLADWACEYTLVHIAVDLSSSVSSYRDELVKCLKEIVATCRRSPRAENLLLAVSGFADDVVEIHGYKPLAAIDPADYDTLRPSGMTALHAAAGAALASLAALGKKLAAEEFRANAILYVLTDGGNNRPGPEPAKIAEAKKQVQKAEHLESLLTVLIGVGINDPGVSNLLLGFEKGGDFDAYEEVDNASEATLAKIAGYASSNIVSQSVAFGTGGPSRLLSL